ncbi:MAG TPA: MATE family efflux transporter [Cryomorphaceae bacterium]|nr:MATE family efflux transporter [Owenweeksia sp.]HBF21790.1 MATE family efflux transporter [Cryomorphaceae bacterium]HCQ16137.1 MATE family efflux transporter [Cryomorphaceae bacterium]|tara:strand:+ start:8251 stop:9660 length:1410 start_codon:yes stop_codon:yes gene_type:complete
MPQHRLNLSRKFFINLRLAIAGEEQEYTSGSIRKAIFMLSIPMILEMCMESVFAVVDMFFVARIGTAAISAVGLTESVITLIYALAIGLSMAATAMVSRRIGEKNPEKASQAAAQAIILGLIVSLLTGAIGWIFPREILGLMTEESEVIEGGYRFTRILIGCNVTIMLIFLINAIFRGAGNASIAMWSLILANGLNIILDPIFIFGLGPIPAYGVEGAAIATTIGRGTAVVFQLYMLSSGKGKVKVLLADLRFKAEMAMRLIRLSLGGIGQFLIGTSSWLFLMRIMSEFGSEVLAGYVIAIRIIVFTILPAWGMSNAAATLVGQNLGAKKPERAEKSVWTTARYNMYFMLSVSVIYIVFANHLIRLFNDTDEVVEAGALCLRIIAGGYLFYAYGMVVSQAFNGAGDTKTPTWINLISFWFFQLPVAYLTALHLEWGPIGVFLAIAVSESLLAVLSILVFRKGKWKETEV